MADPAVIENDEDAVEAKRLQEQCFLINSFEGFAESNEGTTYKHFVPIKHDSPMEIVQKLLAIPDLMGLMSIKPYLLSALVPQIRLYKVHYQTVTSTGVSIEMPFEDFLSPSMLENITASGSQRGMGVGLKSFEWELLGTNPAESDNNIKAKLKLHFNTLEDFVTPRGFHAETETEVSYMNLIVPVAKFNMPDESSDKCDDKQSEGQRSYNNKYFRLKASVGYGTPAGSIWDAAAEGAALKGAIDNARQFFYLTLISHSLDFREDGSLDLEIEYVAAMEGSLIHPKADVLLISDQAEDILENAVERAEKEEDQQEKVDAETEANCKNDDDDTESADFLEEMEEEHAQEAADDKAILYKAILSALEDTGGIYAFSLDAEDVGEISGGQAENAEDISRPIWSKADVMRETDNRASVAGSTAELGDAVGNAADDGGAEASSASAAAEPQEQRIHYFHFGDLLDVALSVLYKNGHPNELSELKCLTGPYVYFNPNTGKLSSQYNMADIPIAMNLFSVWFMDNVVKPQREKYPLKQFIKDAVTGLVGAAMKPACFGKEYGAAPASLSMQLLEVPATSDGKCRVTNTEPEGSPIGGKRVKIEDIMPYPDSIDAETAKAYSYLFMYVSAAGANAFGPPQDGEGTREERDSKLGIYHMRIGSDSGLLKKVKFKKSDQPYAREARMEKAGELDGDSLREKYDADVEMFGNAIFKPGTHCYIDPTTVGAGDPARIETLARRMGLGGYFMVTKVKSAIESGKFSTDLETVWVASGSGKAPTDACGEEDEECDSGQPGVPAEG
jgi:hypothetical protein